MSLAASYQPVARSEYLDRLEALPPSQALAPIVWTAVHDEFQAQLESLETDLRQSVPGIRVAAGRTCGEHFFLFSYRTFCIPGSDLDPVVVGMTFTSADQSLTVEADVSGEQTGDCIWLIPRQTIANSSDGVLAAARQSARNLCQSARAIAAALTDPSRKVE